MKTIAEILAALQAIIDTAADDGERPLTADEMRSYEALELELEQRRKQEELEKRHAQHVRKPRGIEVTSESKAEGELERAFLHWMRTGQDNSDITELRAQSLTDAAGGYTAPEGFRNKLVERMVAYGGIASLAETITTTTGTRLPWPTNDDTANTGELVAEGAAPASAGADLVFGEKQLDAYAYASSGTGNIPLKVSLELLQDSAFDIAGMVGGKLGERLGRIMAVQYATGTGSGQPEGLVNENVTAADSIASNSAGPTYAELLGLVHAVDPAYRGEGCAWLMNDSTLQVLRGIVDTNDRPILMPANDSGYQAALGERLLGYPIKIDQAVPSIGDTTNCIAFGDFRRAFIIRNVRDVTVMRFDELYAVNRQVGFMAWARTDSAIQDANAYAILEGEDTP